MIRKFIVGKAIGAAIFMLISLFEQLQRPAPTCWMAMSIMHNDHKETADRLIERFVLKPIRPVPDPVRPPSWTYPEGSDWQAWLAAQAARKCSRCGQSIVRLPARFITCPDCLVTERRGHWDQVMRCLKRLPPEKNYPKRAPLNWNARGSQ